MNETNVRNLGNCEFGVKNTKDLSDDWESGVKSTKGLEIYSDKNKMIIFL